MIKFRSVKDFSSVKESCLFCNNKLDFVFTNWLGATKPGLPNINSYFNDDKFDFKLKYNSPSANINTKVSINAITNVVSFQDPSKFPLTINTPIRDMVDVLESLQPHIELQCNNKKCRMSYCISSTPFSFNQESNIVTVKPCSAFFECFLWKNLWVQNSYAEDITIITMVTGSVRTDKSITVPKLKFDNLTKDKIINKIKTVVTFS